MPTYNTRNLRDGIVTFKSFTATTSVHHTLTLDEGDLAWSQVQNVIEVLDRGVLSHIRKGDEAGMDISFTLKYQNLSLGASADATTAYEAITGTGAAASWKSTDPNDVYAISLFFQVLNTSDAVEETLEFRLFHHTDISMAEADEYNTLAVSGRSFRTQPVIS